MARTTPVKSAEAAEPLPRSYRALLSVPAFPRLVGAMVVARTAQAMVAVAIVLFVLTRYHSPTLAGWVSFASIFPGLVVSPIAGALLDRRGRVLLMVADYALGAISLFAIALLAIAGHLPPWLLLAIAGVSSLTGSLSTSGLRTLFPMLVPRHLWERANAIDSNGYIVAIIVGPPLAGLLVGWLGGAAAVMIVGLVFAAAALATWGLPDPAVPLEAGQGLIRQAWLGLLYVVHNATLRGLAVTVSVGNLANGMALIILPVAMLGPAHGSPADVGVAWALNGLGGMVSSLVAGGRDSSGKERAMMALPMAAIAVVTLGFLHPQRLVLWAVMAAVGLCVGPFDIALFTLRQKRTHPGWMGRAFAVSMGLNFAGMPIGSALAGPLVTRAGLAVTVLVAAAISAVAAALPYLTLPAVAPEPGMEEPAPADALSA